MVRPQGVWLSVRDRVSNFKVFVIIIIIVIISWTTSEKLGELQTQSTLRCYVEMDFALLNITHYAFQPGDINEKVHSLISFQLQNSMLLGVLIIPSSPFTPGGPFCFLSAHLSLKPFQRSPYEVSHKSLSAGLLFRSATTKWRKALSTVWEGRGAKSTKQGDVSLWVVIVEKPLFMRHQTNK